MAEKACWYVAVCRNTTRWSVLKPLSCRPTYILSNLVKHFFQQYFQAETCSAGRAHDPLRIRQRQSLFDTSDRRQAFMALGCVLLSHSACAHVLNAKLHRPSVVYFTHSVYPRRSGEHAPGWSSNPSGILKQHLNTCS